MQKKLKRILSAFLSMLMMVSAIMLSGIYNVVKAADVTPKLPSSEEVAQLLQNSLTKYSDSDYMNRFYAKHNITPSTESDVIGSSENPNQSVRVIVQMDSEAASKMETSSVKLSDSKSLAQAAKDMNTVEATQAAVKSKVASLSGATIRNTYKYLINGFSAVVKEKDIAKIKSLPGVSNVTKATEYKLDMKYAKNLTQAYDTWKDLGYKGQGMVVAIIDSGVDSSHKDMRLSDNTKRKLTTDSIAGYKKQNPTDGGTYFTDKVPYGYNFADQNTDIVDRNPNTEMHGMHVAGIVAANGTDDEVKQNKAIQGVAPEAQLLALKVFSNNPNFKYCFSDDIVAAIDKAASLGADVINMSLGSSSGFQSDDDPEQQAVEAAAEKGTLVVASSGNDYYSTYPYNFFNDTGVAGSPGIAKDALAVASYENTNLTAKALKVTGGANDGKLMAYYTSDVDPTNVFNASTQYNIVDCGLGNPNDYVGKDVKGKIALIKRKIVNGVSGFVTRKIYAQSQGAVGIIYYNQDGDDGLVSMATDSRITIPAVFISNTDGKTLASDVSQKVVFGNDVVSIDNSEKDNMSDFSSWGPTTDLNMKPEITGPGGNIYSTANSNKYQTMSGTSMSSPHVAGSEALILQAMAAKGLNISGIDKIRFAKATAMNTAKVEIDPSSKLPFSPRRQGAGMVQIENAAKNNVLLTDKNGNANAALKEIGKTTTFTLHLTNYGSNAQVYTLDGGDGPLTQTADSIDSYPYETKILNSNVSFDKASVTVEPGKTSDVNVTITMPDNFAKDQFVEGFIGFKSSDPTVPSLSIPYMGYYGNWNDEPAIDNPVWNTYTIGGTTLVGSTKDDSTSSYYLGQIGKDSNENPIIDPDKIAISPDSSKGFTSVTPALGVLRNIKNFTVDVIDKTTGKVVRRCANDSDVTKGVFNSDKGAPKIDSSWGWDGKIYDSQTGSYFTAPDGQYILRLTSTIDYNGATPQVMDMPVKVDTKGADVSITSGSTTDASGNYTLTWTGKDSGNGASGIEQYEIFAIVKGDSAGTWKLLDQTIDPSEADKDGNFKYTLNGVHTGMSVEVAAMDYAGNITEVSSQDIKSGTAFTNVQFSNIQPGSEINANSLDKNEQFVVNGSVNGVPGNLKINNQDVIVGGDLTFKTIITPKEGRNLISIYATDTSGKVICNYSLPFYLDTQAPYVKLKNNIDNGAAVVNEVYDGYMTVALAAYDNGDGYAININGQQVLRKIDKDMFGGADITTLQNYTFKVPVSDKLNITAVDSAGNQNPQTPFSYDVKNIAPKVGGVVPGGVYKPGVTPVIDSSAVASATLDAAPYTVGQAVYAAEGSHVLVVNGVEGGKTTVDFKISNNVVPSTPIIIPSTDEYTNQPVLIAIGWDPNVVMKQYKIGNGGLQGYVGPFEVAVNAAVYAVGYDAAGNSSDATLSLNNIYTVKPDAPSISQDIKDVTSSDVTITITGNVPKIGGGIQYSIDGDKPVDYTAPFKVSSNCTVSAYTYDVAGNMSSVAKYEISNIDKTAPDAPAIALSNTNMTSKDITVSITYPSDSVNNEYSLDGTTWSQYKDAIIVSQNETIYARATDKAGNVSNITKVISNIDKASKPYKLAKKDFVSKGYMVATANVSKYTEYDGNPVVVFELFKKGYLSDTPVDVVTGEKSVVDSDEMTAGFNINDNPANYYVKVFVLDSFGGDLDNVGNSLAVPIQFGNN